MNMGHLKSGKRVVKSPATIGKRQLTFNKASLEKLSYFKATIYVPLHIQPLNHAARASYVKLELVN